MHLGSVFVGGGISVSAFAAVCCGLVLSSNRQRPLEPAVYHPHAAESDSSGFSSILDSWISEQDRYSQAHILGNMAPLPGDPGAMPGAICASPSRFKPDYYYTWTRDSALVMNEVLTWIEESEASGNGTQWDLLTRMDEYVGFTKHVQGLKTRYGLAEAKYHMDGSPFTKSWCNGQTDGPALRASVLIRYARYLISHGRDLGNLFSSVIVRDLDYVAGVWADNSGCDIWEEARGLHFYTLMAQRRALAEGAQLAEHLGDRRAARIYRQEALRISGVVGGFWSEEKKQVVTTKRWSGGLGTKASGLDSQVLLASLHSGMDDGVFTVESREMTATALRLLRVFEQMYPINRVLSVQVGRSEVPVGVALGRYPEDVYNGVGTSRGNPWSLITSAMAEYHYRLGIAYARGNGVAAGKELAELILWTWQRYPAGGMAGLQPLAGNDLARYLLSIGDLYMARVYLHTDRDHKMYEQWASGNGYGRGAVHLTWSYAAHRAASRARSELKSLVE
ncbi:hypothetical protein LPJ56_005499 [Coemansia sp. RSA 2599]|nr:hypothetical protein LPJ56_005499 [Coemansia sp. RSA 2599]